MPLNPVDAPETVKEETPQVGANVVDVVEVVVPAGVVDVVEVVVVPAGVVDVVEVVVVVVVPAGVVDVVVVVTQGSQGPDRAQGSGQHSPETG